MSNFRPLFGDNYLPSNEGTVDSVQTSYGTEIETSAYDGYSPYVRSRMNPAHTGGLFDSVTNFVTSTGSKAWTGVKSTASGAIDSLVGDAKKKAVAKATEVGGETAGKLVSSALNVRAPAAPCTGGKGNPSQRLLSCARQSVKSSDLNRLKRIQVDNRPLNAFYTSPIINQYPRSRQSLSQIRNALRISQQAGQYRLSNGQTISVNDARTYPIDIELLLVNALRVMVQDAKIPFQTAAQKLLRDNQFLDYISANTPSNSKFKLSRKDLIPPTTPNALSFNIGDGDSPRPRARELAGSPFRFDWTMYEQFLSSRVPSIESTILRLAPNWRTSPISQTQMKTLADELAVNFGARVTISNSQGKYTSPNPENIISQRSIATQLFLPQEQPTQVFVPQETPIQTQAAADAAPAATEEENKKEETPKEKPFLKTPLGITTAVLGTAAVLGGVYYIVSKD